MVLFSSSAAVLQLALLGRLNMQYAGVFAAGSAVASLAGVLLVARAIKRSGVCARRMQMRYAGSPGSPRCEQQQLHCAPCTV